MAQTHASNFLTFFPESAFALMLCTDTPSGLCFRTTVHCPLGGATRASPSGVILKHAIQRKNLRRRAGNTATTDALETSRERHGNSEGILKGPGSGMVGAFSHIVSLRLPARRRCFSRFVSLPRTRHNSGIFPVSVGDAMRGESVSLTITHQTQNLFKRLGGIMEMGKREAKRTTHSRRRL
jgi:hypothetical protein